MKRRRTTGTFIRSVNKPKVPTNGFLISGWVSEQVPDEGFSEEWRILFEERIPLLPDDVVRIEENNFIISIYWQERGNVDELLVFLSACGNLRLNQ